MIICSNYSDKSDYGHEAIDCLPSNVFLPAFDEDLSYPSLYHTFSYQISFDLLRFLIISPVCFGYRRVDSTTFLYASIRPAYTNVVKRIKPQSFARGTRSRRHRKSSDEI